MTLPRFFPIGTPGTPWTASDRAAWRTTQVVRRSYREQVLDVLPALGAHLTVERYGALTMDPARYPLHVVKSAQVVPDAPWALITGGVHGYETSGVQGALAFLANHAADYVGRVNLVVVPCVSPWGYEVIHRWNAAALDPNRCFVPDSPAEESAALMRLLAELDVPFALHLDLHETTDSDETQFRPALSARDGVAYEPGLIPDGFYTVGDTPNPQPAFQAAIIAGVQRVTHIAPADDNGEIIGSAVTQNGVINYPFKALGLCAGVTDATLTSTTEVYPDSPSATPAVCIDAQVAAVRAALDFLVSGKASIGPDTA